MDHGGSFINIACDQPHDHWSEYIYSSYYPNSPHNSKHMFDIYTLTHVFWLALFMWLGKRLAPGYKNEIAIFLFIASSWFEVYENQPEQVIKYRRIEINSSGETSYRGDSLINSLGDILGNGLGIYLGYIMGQEIIWVLVVLFFMITGELGFVYWTDFISFSLNDVKSL